LKLKTLLFTFSVTFFALSMFSISTCMKLQAACKELTTENNNYIQENSKLNEENKQLESYSLSLEESNEHMYESESETINKELSIIEPIKDYDKKEYLIQYKNIFKDIPNAPENIYDVYTQKEINYMCRVIETETYGADFISKCNVASVIINRIENPKFPDNPIDVVTQANQFAYFRTYIPEDTILALEYAYMIEDTTNGCIGFNSFKNPPTYWNGLTYQFTDNVGQSFYK
jgi:hypothetical protein